MPEPQKPQVKPPEDIVRSNHYDPEEDEEYYRKQLSYFDRRSFENKPSAHVPASHLSELPSQFILRISHIFQVILPSKLFHLRLDL